MRSAVIVLLALGLATVLAEEQQLMRGRAGPIEADDDTFDKYVGKQDTVVEFYAPWCPHCVEFAPQLDDAAKKLKREHVNVVKVDADSNEGIAHRFGVDSYPTVKFFPAGQKQPADEYQGDLSADGLTEWVEQEKEDEKEGVSHHRGESKKGNDEGNDEGNDNQGDDDQGDDKGDDDQEDETPSKHHREGKEEAEEGDDDQEDDQEDDEPAPKHHRREGKRARRARKNDDDEDEDEDEDEEEEEEPRQHRREVVNKQHRREVPVHHQPRCRAADKAKYVSRQ